jgi:DNA modification methylase
MGSGMLPAGAYVTLEHEHILIFRKTGKRVFETKEKSKVRQESAFFWEERNSWFSDVWELKGIKQKIEGSITRERSGAYPFELAYRLINMFSVKHDVVLDPFLGTGTTTLAAIAAERNSIGYEIDEKLSETIDAVLDKNNLSFVNNLINKRIVDHLNFVEKRIELKGSEAFKHSSNNYGFPVITKQEREMLLSTVTKIERQELNSNTIISHHKSNHSLQDFSFDNLFATANTDRATIFREKNNTRKISSLSS